MGLKTPLILFLVCYLIVPLIASPIEMKKPVKETVEETKPEEETVEETKPVVESSKETKPVEATLEKTKSVEETVKETKPVEETAVDTKPVEETAEDTKPVEETEENTKPVEETAEETKPVEETADKTKPVEETAEETKPVQETKPIEETVEETKLVKETAVEAKPVVKTSEETKLVEETAEETKTVEETKPLVETVEKPLEDTLEETKPLVENSKETKPPGETLKETKPVKETSETNPVEETTKHVEETNAVWETKSVETTQYETSDLAVFEPLKFSIEKSWDGAGLNHSTQIRLYEKNGFIHFSVLAPFYNDTPPAGGKAGEAYYSLWNHEVVEAFFLNPSDQYLEVELGPYSQHLLLLLNGRRNAIKHSLPIEYRAEINPENGTWSGEARIPIQYFPPNLNKFNAYAIHGPAEDRRYEALYEVSGPEPDFHLLSKFQPFPNPVSREVSDIWISALMENTDHQERKMSGEYEVGLSWDGETKVENPAKISFTARGEDLELRVVAPFYNDPAPPGAKPGESYFKLWDYEVVEAFFLNGADEYLELEFGPHGNHLMLILAGTKNAIKHSLPLDYTASINKDDNTWEGRAIIPGSYFPPNVTKFNGYAIHGTGDNRTYETVYEVSGPQPDFHRINKFGPLHLADILPSNARTEHSDIWTQAIVESNM